MKQVTVTIIFFVLKGKYQQVKAVFMPLSSKLLLYGALCLDET